MILPFIESIRPRQWTKNLLLFAGLIFSQSFFNVSLLFKSVCGFICFCAISSALYLFNDLIDVKQDRLHPLKSSRPLPSGRLSSGAAVTGSILLAGSGLICSFLLHTGFGLIALIYFLLITGYTLFFKKMVILDVMVIAVGFVLRAVAGTSVIDVSISSWLLVCTIFLALFLGLNKRRNELEILSDKAGKHRKILGEYTIQLLDQMIAVVTASTIMAYALYTTSPTTVEKFGTRNLLFTLPFVLYGIFRYQYLVFRKKMGGSPELILFRDVSMIVNIVLYFLCIILIIYCS